MVHDLAVRPVAVAVVLADGVAERAPLAHADAVAPALPDEGVGPSVASREEVGLEPEVDVELGTGMVMFPRSRRA